MRATSFPDWLEQRLEEIPDATTLAMQIARSGAAGISHDRLRKVLEISPETLDDLLRALVSAGQVTVVSVNGEVVYRAAG